MCYQNISKLDKIPYMAEYKKSNFRTAFLFLNREKRKALSLIYSFMREIDDTADKEKNKNSIIILRKKIEKIYSDLNLEDEFLSNLRNVVKRFDIPKYVFVKLIDGVEKDLIDVDIQTRRELEDYMFCVAGTVGISVLKIVEYKGNDLDEIATQTGFAVQMTNILRDLKEDLKINRNYIPKEERMKFFKSGEIDFNSENFKDFFDFEKKLTFKYYENAENLFIKSKTFKLFIPALMKNIYFELLKQLDFELNPKNHKISNYKRFKAIIRSMIEIIF